MDRLCSNALQLSEFLQGFEDISVNYPALKSSPYYDLVQKQLGGRGGAILTIDAGTKERAFKLINGLKYATIATNIGDIRTLVIHPESTIFTHSFKEQKEHAGIFEGTIRVSIGIEDIKDLKEDFEQAIKNI
jgi:O-acetylhomoserine (thiol)-lyase